jgi:hypothetical protein
MSANSIRTNTPQPPSPISPLQLSKHTDDGNFDHPVAIVNGGPALSKPRLSLDTDFTSSLLTTAAHRAKQVVIHRDTDDPDSPETPKTPPSGCGRPDTPPSGQVYPPGHRDAYWCNVKVDCEEGQGAGDGDTTTSELLTGHVKILKEMLSMDLTTPADSPDENVEDWANGHGNGNTAMAEIYQPTQRWEANVSRKVVVVHQNGEKVQVISGHRDQSVVVLHQKSDIGRN